MADLTPVALLRAAAVRVRETAKDTAPGPWIAQDFVLRHGLADAGWIALASPLLAEPLAAWLEIVADLIDAFPGLLAQHAGDEPCACHVCRVSHAALAVARVVLGEVAE